MTDSMEVSYLLAMLRRRIRVLVLGVLLGVLLALLLGSVASRYQAQAQLLIGAPATGGSDANSLERNLNSQLSVLRSRETARAVSERVDGRLGTQEVVQATEISEVAGADVVLIQTTASGPALAAAVADAYVDVYLETSAERAQARIAPELQRLDQRLAQIDREIALTNQQLAAAVAPFLRRTGPGAAIPDPRTVAPDAAARQQLLLSEYDRLLSQRQDIEQQQQLRSASSVLQEAVADERPLGPDRRRQVAVVLIAGLVSIAVALAVDALSGRAVTDHEVERALGARIAARFRRDRRLQRSPLGLLDRPATEDERLLWLRAERLLPAQGTALIVVTGAVQGSGSTTVALSLANQFELSGHRAILVDAAAGPSSLTTQLGATDDGGLPTLLQDATAVEQALSPLEGNLQLLGRGRSNDRVSRAALVAAVAALSHRADVIVIDAEPTLGPAVSVAPQAHAIVLVVDGARAKATQLEELGLVLADFRGKLLPVLTHPSKRRGAVPGRSRRPGAAALSQHEASGPVPTGGGAR